ncbi:DUF1360 domain-containing protein [Streptomyces sp. NPDC004658]|uniref:DUF1360 domain-containing protein n=1 Tax=Streptomyces sp. NPDC004658 TaxID=3154672 RepID=UPI0033A2FABF
MTTNLITCALALGACLRLTRLVVDDDISEPFRQKIHGMVHHNAKPESRYSGLWAFLSRLVGCTWCASMWVAGGIVPVAAFYGDTLLFRLNAGVLTLSWLVGILVSWLDSPPPVRHIVHHLPEGVRFAARTVDASEHTKG